MRTSAYESPQADEAPGPATPTARPVSGRAPTGPERPAVIADAVRIVACLSISAGLIHAIATVDHFSHYWLYGVFFLAATYGQVLWGVGLLRGRFADRTLLVGACANLALVAIWLSTRTIGVPFGPEAPGTEPVGSMDVAVTLDQVVLIAYCAVILRPDLRIRRGFRTLLGPHRVRLGMALCSATVFMALIGGHQH